MADEAVRAAESCPDAAQDKEYLKEVCRMAQIMCLSAMEAKQRADNHYHETFRLYEQAIEDYRRALSGAGRG